MTHRQILHKLQLAYTFAVWSGTRCPRGSRDARWLIKCARGLVDAVRSAGVGGEYDGIIRDVSGIIDRYEGAGA